MALQLHLSSHVPTTSFHPRRTPPAHQTPTIRLRWRHIRASAGGLASSSSGAGDTYLDMWKRAVERENMDKRFRRVLDNSPGNNGGGPPVGAEADAGAAVEETPEELERKTLEFNKILEVPAEKRDRVQRMQVIDRAAAAIAAARAILAQNPTPHPTPPPPLSSSPDEVVDRSYDGIGSGAVSEVEVGPLIGDKQGGGVFDRQVTPSQGVTPGPDFWSWIPPTEDDSTLDGSNNLLWVQKPSEKASRPVLEKDRSEDSLSLPFESKLKQSKISLPPMESLLESEKTEGSDIISENTTTSEEHDAQSLEYSEEAARALDTFDEKPSQGRSPDGSRWWRITGVDTRPDGVVCRWTMTRGVTADEAVEWEDKFWEASDEFGYKELGSEKSGRDANGSVWHEYWRESMWQEGGLMHMEKTADKWGKRGEEIEWQEKWWEHYDASGKTDKWAHKWCSLDPTTEVEVGHAHVWHERWGEKYDGFGGSEKYTDKWAERFEGDGWSKWGDKWDEHFDLNSNGVKQGETWWQGKYGEQWNRTWGEGHNGSGWVHKYGKSSCGEHWDNHAFEDTWYERYPHYGFMHCLENTIQLRDVKRPSELE